MIQRKHPLAECEKCPLARRDCAPSSGPDNAKVALVSRSPGRWDAEYRKPFAGPSGRVLDHLLELNGYERKDILTTNIVLCETDDPPMDAIVACRERLRSELSQADLIIVAGAEAVKELIGNTTITNARRRNHTRTLASGRSQRLVATTNPAAVLRESGNFPDMIRDFKFALNPTPPPKLPQVWYSEEPKEVLEIINDVLLHQLQLASDLETFGYTSSIACAGFAANRDLAYVFGYDALQDETVRKALKQLYESSSIEFVWHNGKYDCKVLRQNGIKGRVDQDTFLLSYALDERPGGSYQGDQGAGLHALTPTLMQEYGWPNYETSGVKEFKKNARFIGTTPQELERNRLEVYDYNGKDTAGTLVLLDDFVEAAKLDEVYEWPYRNLSIPLANALIDVELRGFCYNRDKAADLNENYVRPMLAKFVEDMQRITGRELYNPRSPKQNSGIFYEQYGLKHNLKDTRKKVKSTSTDKDVRKEIIEGRFECKPGKKEEFVEFITKLDSFTKVETMRSRYVEGLIEKVADDGKLYSTFKFGTVSGRLSSEGPNFQNITRAGVEGLPSVRSLFEPSPGCTLVSADYSQAELRTIAQLSGDNNLLAIYRDSARSLHKERAAVFYGEGYSYEEYVKAKNVNFGVTYGQSAFTFSQMYNMPLEEAQAYIDAWWRDFPLIAEWVKKVQTEAQVDGYVKSPFGHKRRFHLITRENVQEVLREAVNFLPQNIAGGLTELALVELVSRGVPIVTSVHDSIVADVASGDVYNVANEMKQVMEEMPIKVLGWPKDKIPFAVDISISEADWAHMEEVDLKELIAA